MNDKKNVNPERKALTDEQLDIVTGGERPPRTKNLCERCGKELKYYEGPLCDECQKNPIG